MAGDRVHTDDIVVPVLEPDLNRTRTARLWVYVRDDRPFAGPDPAVVFYLYTLDRKGEHPRVHLTEFRGILQTGGYAGFAMPYGSGRVLERACLAHARRKLWDVHEAMKPPLGREALDRIGALYRIDDATRPICAVSSSVSPITRSTASKTSCCGTPPGSIRGSIRVSQASVPILKSC